MSSQKTNAYQKLKIKMYNHFQTLCWCYISETTFYTKWKKKLNWVLTYEYLLLTPLILCSGELSHQYCNSIAPLNFSDKGSSFYVSNHIIPYTKVLIWQRNTQHLAKGPMTSDWSAEVSFTSQHTSLEEQKRWYIKMWLTKTILLEIRIFDLLQQVKTFS